MGNEGKNSASQHTLVVMSNKDTYYLRDTSLRLLRAAIRDKDGFFQFIDARSDKHVTINLSQFSSIVETLR